MQSFDRFPSFVSLALNFSLNYRITVAVGKNSSTKQSWHYWIARIIQGGIKRGEIRSTVDAKATATLLIACLEGGLMLSKLHDDPIYLQQVIAHLQTYIASDLSV